MPTQSSGSVRAFYPLYSREQLIDLLRDRITEVGRVLPLQQATLFGSWTTNRATAFSDIDILFIYSGPARDDAYYVLRRTLDVRGVEPHVYSENEAALLQSTIERMSRDGVNLLDSVENPA